jgi:hypothetical protein
VVFRADGGFYLAELGDNVVRKVTFPHPASASSISLASGSNIGPKSFGSTLSYQQDFPFQQGLVTFGDSFCVGTGSTNPSTLGFCNLLGLNYFGGPFANYAFGGDASADTVHKVYAEANQAYPGSPTFIYESGANETGTACFAGGSYSNCLLNYYATVRASVAWLAVPASLKIYGQNTAICTTTGTWVADNTLTAGVALAATAPGSSITCATLNNSPVLYVAWRAFTGSNTTASLSINSGADTDTLNAFGFGGTSVTTGQVPPATDTVFANRYVVNGGASTFTITANTASAAQPFSFVWAGSPPADQGNGETSATPPVVVVGTPWLPYVQVQPLSSSTSNTAPAWADPFSVANQLAADGLITPYASSRAYEVLNSDANYIPTTTENGTTCPATTAWPWHPDDCGHAHLAEAVIAAIEGTGVPAVTLSATSLAFGSEPVGNTTASQSVTMTNSGTATLNIASIAVGGANPSSYGFANSCGSTLAAGTNCTIHGHFAPTTSGSLPATITIADNASSSPQTITLSGTGTGAPAVTLSATSIAFGTQTYGSYTNAQTVTLSNSGAATLYLGSIGLTGIYASSYLQSNNCVASLAVGASCTIRLRFNPQIGITPALAVVPASLTIADNAPNSPQIVSLTGTPLAITPTIIWSQPGPITYGTPLSGTQLNATSSVGGTFSYSPAAGTVLGAGVQTLTVTFTPTDTTDYSTATASVSLTVNAASPAMSWVQPGPITYGTALSVMQLDATSSVAGTFSYSPAAGTVLGAGVQTLTATFTPTDTTDYSTATASVSLTVNAASPAISWGQPGPITYGTPLSGTQLNATSSVAGTFSYSPAAGTVLGAGVQTLTATFTPTDTGDYLDATATVQLMVSGPAPANVSLSATSLSFGTQAVGTLSASQTVTLTNTGSATLTISSISVTGAGASSFGFANSCGTALVAGANCTIHGHFGPTASGASTAAIIITDNASDSPQSVTLSGTGGGSPAVSLSSTSLSFGTQAVGTLSASQTVTLTNTGSATLTISSISVTGAGASSFGFANNCGTSLAAGANCTIHGHFAPTTTGALTASVTITDSASNSPQTIALSGTGD